MTTSISNTGLINPPPILPYWFAGGTTVTLTENDPQFPTSLTVYIQNIDTTGMDDPNVEFPGAIPVTLYTYDNSAGANIAVAGYNAASGFIFDPIGGAVEYVIDYNSGTSQPENYALGSDYSFLLNFDSGSGIEIMYTQSSLSWSVVIPSSSSSSSHEHPPLSLPTWWTNGTTLNLVEELDTNNNKYFFNFSPAQPTQIITIEKWTSDGANFVEGVLVNQETRSDGDYNYFLMEPLNEFFLYKLIYENTSEEKGVEIIWNNATSTWIVKNDLKLEISYEFKENGSNEILTEITVDGSNTGPADLKDKTYFLIINGKLRDDLIGWELETFDIEVSLPNNLFVHATGIQGEADYREYGALYDNVSIPADFWDQGTELSVSVDQNITKINIAASRNAHTGGVGNEFPIAAINFDFDEVKLAQINKYGGVLDVMGIGSGSLLKFEIKLTNNIDTVLTKLVDTGENTEFDVLEIANAASNGDDITLKAGAASLEFVNNNSNLVIGTYIDIGYSSRIFTNLVRQNDTFQTNVTIQNTGNLDLTNLSITKVESRTDVNVNIGTFSNIIGPGQEAEIGVEIQILGNPGQLVDLRGIIKVNADGLASEGILNNVGSTNLITFKGDIAYNGRVGMLDIAYLNAGVRRVGKALTANHCDANLDGTVSTGDLSQILDDWNKSLHGVGTDNEQYNSWESSINLSQLESHNDQQIWDNTAFNVQHNKEKVSGFVDSTSM